MHPGPHRQEVLTHGPCAARPRLPEKHDWPAGVSAPDHSRELDRLGAQLEASMANVDRIIAGMHLRRLFR